MEKPSLKKRVFNFFFRHSWLLNNPVSSKIYLGFRELFKDTSIMDEPRLERRKLLDQLRVFDTPQEKIRLGNANDGGYVIVDLEKGFDGLLSYGIGQDNSFELDWVQQYEKRAFLFDHTIADLNEYHDLLTFVCEGISSTMDTKTDTLESHFNRFGDEATSNWFLKLDIEDVEWEILKHISPDLLARFSQIVIEFHDLNSMNIPLAEKIRVLSKLNSQFYIVHAHANNYSHVLRQDGIYPNVLELTFLRRDLIKLTSYLKTPLPLSIDAPNYKYLDDHHLDSYPFISQD